MVFKIVPVAVVMAFEAYTIAEAKANQLEGRCHLERYGLIAKYPWHLFSAVMGWRRPGTIQTLFSGLGGTAKVCFL